MAGVFSDGPVPFHVDVHRLEDSARVVVAGELDIATAPQLQDAIDGILRDRVDEVVLDLRELEFLDSTGIALVVGIDRVARRDGLAFAVVRGGPQIQRVFTIAGLDEHLAFIDSPPLRAAAS